MKYVLKIHEVSFLYHPMESAERERHVDVFQGNRADNEPGNTRKGTHPPSKIRFLISTYRILGTGYTCTATKRVFLLELAEVSKDMMQAIGRVVRCVQQAPECLAHIVYSPEMPLDRYCRQKMESRRDEFGGLLPG